jgi:D-cysteine desulfhydrase family pyridoxal phosphate-dependent enzyme
VFKAAISIQSLKTRMDSFPRCPLAHLPTPLDSMKNLSDALGINLFIKRDDLTGLALGGNKSRKLEFLMADVLAKGADCVITWAGVQSNWCCQLAAAARKKNVKPVLILFKTRGLPVETSGNLLLDRIYDATIVLRDSGKSRKMMQFDAVRDVVEEVAEQQRKAGYTPYIAPIGASLMGGSMSRPLGALGYVNALVELLEQSRNIGFKIDSLVIATGSGSMQAGLLTGARLLAPQIRVIGISVSANRQSMTGLVEKIAKRTMKEFNRYAEPRIRIEKDDIIVFDDYIRKGYGILDSETINTIHMVARKEGVLLDPVYTGKAFSGLVDLVRNRYVQAGENVVFLHTGGTPALFPYGRFFIKPKVNRSKADGTVSF